MLDQREVLNDEIAQLNVKLATLQDQRAQITLEMKPIKERIDTLRSQLHSLQLTIGSKWWWKDVYYGKRTFKVIYVDAQYVIYLDVYNQPSRDNISSFLKKAKRVDG